MGGAAGTVTLHNLHEARNLREVCFAPEERETEAEMPEPGPPVNDSLEQRACLISDPSPHPATGSLKGGLVSLYFNSWMCPGKDQHQVSGLASGRTLLPAPGMPRKPSCPSTSGSGAKPQSCSLPWISSRDERVAEDLVTFQFKEPAC